MAVLQGELNRNSVELRKKITDGEPSAGQVGTVAAALEQGLDSGSAAEQTAMEAAVTKAVASAEAAAVVKAAAVMKAGQEQSERIVGLLQQLKVAEQELQPLRIVHKGRTDREVALENQVMAMTLGQVRKELTDRGMSTLIVNKDDQCVEGRTPDLQRRLILQLAGLVKPDGGIGSHAAAAAAVAAAMGEMPAQLKLVRQEVHRAANTAMRLFRQGQVGDTVHFEEAVADLYLALEAAQSTASGPTPGPDELTNFVSSRFHPDHSAAAARLLEQHSMLVMLVSAQQSATRGCCSHTQQQISRKSVSLRLREPSLLTLTTNCVVVTHLQQ